MIKENFKLTTVKGFVIMVPLFSLKYANFPNFLSGAFFSADRLGLLLFTTWMLFITMKTSHVSFVSNISIGHHLKLTSLMTNRKRAYVSAFDYRRTKLNDCVLVNYTKIN